MICDSEFINTIYSVSVHQLIIVFVFVHSCMVDDCSHKYGERASPWAGIKVNIIKDRPDRPNHDKALGGTGGSTLERSEVRALMRSIV